MKSVGIAVLFVAAALVLTPADVLPHYRSVSYSTWQVDPEGARVEFRIKRLELTRLPAEFYWVRYLPEALELYKGDEPCLAGAVRAASAPGATGRAGSWGRAASTSMSRGSRTSFRTGPTS